MEDLLKTPTRPLRNKHLENIQGYSTPLQIPPSPYLRELGYGTGVSVYRLERSPKLGQLRSPWAIKRVIKRMRADESGKLFNERILKEADILGKLNHPNIVGYRGIVKNSKGVSSLALECCSSSLGDILENRHDSKLGALPAKQCIVVISDIAQALDYLHTEARILHCDVKSFNILINGDFEICKLCDFGVSMPLDENGEINSAKNPKYKYIGTKIWSAPEVIAEEDIIDSKADIFSFGLTIYETLALVPPHMHVFQRDDEIENKDNSNIVDTSLEGILKPNKLRDNCDKDNEDKSEGEAKGGASDDDEYDGEEYDDDEYDEDEDDVISDMLEAVGTRPPFPMHFELTDEYNLVVELFYYCTNTCSEDRPTAKTIWQSIENMRSTEKKQNNADADKDKDAKHFTE